MKVYIVMRIPSVVSPWHKGEFFEVCGSKEAAERLKAQFFGEKLIIEEHEVKQ